MRRGEAVSHSHQQIDDLPPCALGRAQSPSVPPSTNSVTRYWRPSNLADLVHGDNVRVVQRRGHLRFPLEAATRTAIEQTRRFAGTCCGTPPSGRVMRSWCRSGRKKTAVRGYPLRRTRPMVTDPESSVELLERARAGGFQRTRPVVRMLFAPAPPLGQGRLPRGARDLSDTDDLVQDTVFRTLRHIDGFHPQRGGRAPGVYLRQAIMNRIRDELRRAKRRPPPEGLADDVRSPLASPLDEAIGEEATQRYEAALAELRDEEREAIVARIELQCSYDEMAVMLESPVKRGARGLFDEP